MQSLLADKRSIYTNDQMIALLQAADFEMIPGVELLDSNDLLVSDLSDYLSGGSITRDCNAAIHGTCSLDLSYELNWGVDRLLPYVLCSAPSLGLLNVRFNLGIYLVTTPDTTLGENPAQYSITGYDKLYFLNQPVGDSVIAPQGGDVLLQVENLIAAATNNDPKVSLDSDASGTLLPADVVWPLSSTPSTYLDIINSLLASISYQAVWVDQDGYYSAAPLADPSTLTPEWTFTVQDTDNNIVADPRVRTQDTFDVPNWWRFVRNGLTTAPAEGTGFFTYQDNDTPLTGYSDRGYLVKRVYFVDAVDQQTLQNLAAIQIILDTNVPESWSVPSGPLPQSGHFDIVELIDTDIDGGLSSRKCVVQSWTFQLDGTEMDRTMNTAMVILS